MEEQIEYKQKFLRESILEQGYDVDTFVNFMISYLGREEFDLSKWKFSMLTNAVEKFKKSVVQQQKYNTNNNNININNIYNEKYKSAKINEKFSQPNKLKNKNEDKEKNNLKKEYENLKNENEKQKKEKGNLIKENQILKDRNKTLEKENNNLKIELNKLNLIKDVKTVKINDNYKTSIEEKVKMIENFKSELNKNVVEYKKYNELKNEEKLIAINFISVDQRVNHSIICNNKTKFHEIENQLYEKYPEYGDNDNYFIFNGNKIKRFKSLEENEILGYTIILQKIDDE